LTDEVLGRVAHEERQSAFLDLGRLTEVHGGKTLENTLIAEI
jgi:hypothetical protein